MSASIIYYKTKKIIYVDYSHCNSWNEMLKLIREGKKLESPAPEETLVLADFNKIFDDGLTIEGGGIEFVQQCIDFVSDNKSSGKTTRVASINVGMGVKKFIYTSFLALADKKNNRYFESQEDALNWLVSDEDNA